MNVYKFRVIVDTEEDVFRDIEIDTKSTFEQLHHAILKSFDFPEGEMASFYMSNDQWDKGQEVSLEDMGEMGGGVPSMSTTLLSDMIHEPDEKVIYVYDFLRMWCFYIELLSIHVAAPSIIYPQVSMIFGEAPEFESKEVDLFGDLGIPEMEESKPEKTGDPELDAYLFDEDDDEDEPGFESLDDLDEYM